MSWAEALHKAPLPAERLAPQPSGIVLAPGESYDPQGGMWYLAAYGTGGEAGWRRFLDTFPSESTP